MKTPKTSEGAPGRDGPPPARSAEGRPFTLEMIYADLTEIRESLAEIVHGGEKWSTVHAVAAINKADSLIIRIAVEYAMGKVAR